ncbi:phosphoenolpyruvate--protein phosphotransferase [Ignavibacteria bacterium]
MQPAKYGVERRFKGIPASPGIAIGEAALRLTDEAALYNETIVPEVIESEKKRFTAAVQTIAEEYRHIFELAQNEENTVLPILETYLMILTDTLLADAIRRRIASGLSAESAVYQEFDAQKQFFTATKDPILRERAVDLDNVRERLLAGLRNATITHALAANKILMAQTVTPTDLMLYRSAGILGFATEIGGIASHSSILARSFSMPAVIGLRDAAHSVRAGEIVILDGYAGLLIVNPKPETLVKFEKRKQQEEENRQKLGKLAKLSSQTTDGRAIRLQANIDSLEDVDAAMMLGADGVGLVRTEYLIAQLQRFPTEEEQYEWYKEIAERAYPRPITIRAFDVGGDKYAEGVPHEENPALGLRGIRFLLYKKEIFSSQTRAVLRASVHRNIRLMLPMVSTLAELCAGLDFIATCKKQLAEHRIPFDADTPVGIMIETPAAAVMADDFARYADFFSIGTNDLTQYALAADRSNEYVAAIFDSFDPAVLRLMQIAVRAAKKRKIPVSVCGEIAGDPNAAELLIGMGVDELSVTPTSLLMVKKHIRKVNAAKATNLAEDAIRCSDNNEVRQFLSSRRRKAKPADSAVT